MKALQFAVETTKLRDFTFKPKQVDILYNLFKGHDVLGILPTGYGKSLTFHLLPNLLKKLDQTAGQLNPGSVQSSRPNVNSVLVVSPLNALISNQVDRVNNLGFSAISVGWYRPRPDSEDENDDATTGQDRHTNDISKLRNEEFHYIFLHPETLFQSPTLKDALR